MDSPRCCPVGSADVEVRAIAELDNPDQTGSQFESLGALPGQLTIEGIREHDRHVLAIGGEVDMASVPELEAALQAVGPAPGEQLVLDLSGVSFMDSSGLHLLLKTARAAHSGGFQLVLTHVPQQVMKILELSLMRDVFTITA